jgi:hypothetical protein
VPSICGRCCVSSQESPNATDGRQHTPSPSTTPRRLSDLQGILNLIKPAVSRNIPESASAHNSTLDNLIRCLTNALHAAQAEGLEGSNLKAAEGALDAALAIVEVVNLLCPLQHFSDNVVYRKEGKLRFAEKASRLHDLQYSGQPTT